MGRLSFDDDGFNTLLLLSLPMIELDTERFSSDGEAFNTLLLLIFSDDDDVTLLFPSTDEAIDDDDDDEGFFSFEDLDPVALFLSSASAPSPMPVMSLSSVVPLNRLNTFLAMDFVTSCFVCSGLPSATIGAVLPFINSENRILTS